MNIKYNLIIMDTKRCKENSGGCGKFLPKSEFYLKDKRTGNYNTICNACKKIKNKKYYLDNIDKFREHAKEYNDLHREELNRNQQIRQKKYIENNREKHREYVKEYRVKNREKFIKKEKERNKDPKRIANRKDRFQKRMNNEPNFRIGFLIGNTIRKILRNKKIRKVQRTSKYVSCSFYFLVKLLESQFKDDMNWGNHGFIWELDHIIPINYFNLENIEEQKMAFHYSNLQPLYKKENRAKSDKLFPQILYRAWNGDRWVDFRELKLLPKPQESKPDEINPLT